VTETKNNYEVVGWREIDQSGFKKMKKQTEREGGQFHITKNIVQGELTFLLFLPVSTPT